MLKLRFLFKQYIFCRSLTVASETNISAILLIFYFSTHSTLIFIFVEILSINMLRVKNATSLIFIYIFDELNIFNKHPTEIMVITPLNKFHIIFEIFIIILTVFLSL